MLKQKIFIYKEGLSEMNLIPQKVPKSRLNATIDNAAIHFPAIARRNRAIKIPPYRHQTRIAQLTFFQSISMPVKNPVTFPIVNKPNPSHNRRELATVNALIGGSRKKIEPGCCVFNWRS